MKGAMMKFFLVFPFFLSIASAVTPSVIIVGAGMSGISAAKKLTDKGVKDFLILEATNRIGGRIRKKNFAGYTIEMGANWLHGVGGHVKNPVYEMSEQIHLKKFFSDFSNVSSNTYQQEGGLYKKDEVDAALKKTEQAEEFGIEMCKKLTKNKRKYDDMSILDLERLNKTGGLYKKDEVDAALKKTEQAEEFGIEMCKKLTKNKRKYDDMSILDLERLNKTEPRTILENIIDYFTFDGEYADAPKFTSFKHILPMPEDYDFGTNAYFVADPRGFESLVHVVAKQFLTYNKKGVISDRRVRFNQVVREVEQSKNGLIIRIENGKVYNSKLVILSPSLGVLQSDLITFKPSLPEWKRRSISDFHIGIYTKIFLKFPHKFWPTDKGTEFFFYVHEQRGHYAIWQHLESEHPGSNILFVTVTDEESERIENQPDYKTKAEVMEVLRKMFGKNIPEATKILIPRWKSDRLYRGCFTNWPVGYSQKRHDQLRAPIGGIYFTGEHTHPRYFGYVSGAYYAGSNTAKEVIKCLKNNICKDKL